MAVCCDKDAMDPTRIPPPPTFHIERAVVALGRIATAGDLPVGSSREVEFSEPQGNIYPVRS